MNTQSALTVFFDGSCPLCKREIAFYQNQPGAEQITWLNVADNNPDSIDSQLPEHLSRDQLMARFHVQDYRGNVFSGGDAFVKVWALLPRFKFLAVIFALPVFRQCFNWGYDLLLRFRPAMQRRACQLFDE